MATANKIINVSDRVERAKALLLYQFKDKPNINALVDVVVSELQELENAITDLQEARTLKGSYGVFLDEIGKRLKVDRGNYADPDYKTTIKIAMAKKTASATAQDILFLVELLTADPNAILTNNYPYMAELTGYLYCIADDPAGLEALADLFPVNTRVRLIQHFDKSFKFGTAGRGFGSGSTLNSLVYHRYGDIDNPSFNVSPVEVTPPPLTTAPFIIISPYATGENTEGSTLTVDNGEWGGNTPIVYEYQWLRDGSNIAGETNQTYILTSDDLGLSVSCSVTATNLYGSDSKVTNVVVVDSTPTPTAILTEDIGLSDIYSNVIYSSGGDVSVDAILTFASDGTTVRDGNSTINDQWLTTTGVGLGANHTLSYSVVSGEPFANLNPNVLYDLTSPITFTVNETATGNRVNTSTYNFTIRSKTDISISKTKQITMTAEIIDFSV
ncbi:hypothetical protein Barba3A_gp120 [Rheinheimera phage vB_RspM_Barba3A]|uniref:Ig-like domain-containing protein n=1 Tax=Rheinheimera phage vB_RspM_Barba3A TaxID=2565687 RepID=A0A4P8MZ06_9CAUD|nr:hypothetical protein Barba3A_gp120 [Rheinheimera phage vB_RspM_Barba3A]